MAVSYGGMGTLRRVRPRAAGPGPRLRAQHDGRRLGRGAAVGLLVPVVVTIVTLRQGPRCADIAHHVIDIDFGPAFVEYS